MYPFLDYCPPFHSVSKFLSQHKLRSIEARKILSWISSQPQSWQRICQGRHNQIQHRSKLTKAPVIKAWKKNRHPQIAPEKISMRLRMTFPIRQCNFYNTNTTSQFFSLTSPPGTKRPAQPKLKSPPPSHQKPPTHTQTHRLLCHHHTFSSLTQ